MAGTLPLPSQTYDPAHGPYVFGPQSVAPGDTKIVVTVDRTVAGGLNSLTAAASVALTAEQSNDGGATWFVAVGTTWPGGQFFHPQPPRGDGALVTQSVAAVDVYGSGPGRQLRATVVAAGSPVALAGTLTVT